MGVIHGQDEFLLFVCLLTFVVVLFFVWFVFSSEKLKEGEISIQAGLETQFFYLTHNVLLNSCAFLRPWSDFSVCYGLSKGHPKPKYQRLFLLHGATGKRWNW